MQALEPCLERTKRAFLRVTLFWRYRLSTNFSLEGSIKFDNSFIFYGSLSRALTPIYGRNS